MGGVEEERLSFTCLAGNYIFVTLQAVAWIALRFPWRLFFCIISFVEELFAYHSTSFVSHFCVALSFHHWKGRKRERFRGFHNFDEYDCLHGSR